MNSPSRAASRGFSFTELMVVMVLAGIVTLGLVTFYLNSQVIWTGASTQVLAQRDATSLIEVMRDSTQTAADAIILPIAADSANKLVILFDGGGGELTRFFWDPADSCVHNGVGGLDRGPITPTTVERFHATFDQTLGLLSIDTLRVRSSAGQRVTYSTTIALYNRP